MTETLPLKHEGNLVTREPMARNMGLTLHSKKMDEFIDEDMTFGQLKQQAIGLIQVAGPKSFLIWHVCLLFDWFYTVFYIVLMIALHVYKYLNLEYPPSVWVMELLGLLMLATV